jgi:hypothetical protein
MSKWKVKEQEEITCSLVEKPRIILNIRVQYKIELLMKEYTNQEWMGYLTGNISKNTLYAKDLVIPPHAEASGASAEAEPFHVPDNCLGVIHSHHGMGAFHSGTDKDYVDKNYPVSITVARNGTFTYDAVSVAKTPCGKTVYSPCTVLLERVKPDFNAEEWMKEAKDNIEKNKKFYTPNVGNFYTPGNGYGDYYVGSDLYHNGVKVDGAGSYKRHNKVTSKNPPRLFSNRYGKVQDDGELFAGRDGVVMTKKELDAHVKEIFDD